MLTFNDVLKNSFRETLFSETLTTTQLVMAILVTGVIALYIFFCYRVMTRKTFYSRSFNVSLVAMAILTAGVILTIRSSLVVSLGMVGALSIVRFRTAIREPMDLLFMFWSICIGIMCGAGLAEVAVFTSLAVTFFLILLDRIPAAAAPMLLVVNTEKNTETDEKIRSVIRSHDPHFKVKTRTVTASGIDMIFEVRVRDDIALSDEIAKIGGVTGVSLMSHDGEATF